MKAGGGRQKGAQFERDIAKALDEALGIKFHRNLRQYQKAGLDDLTREDGKAIRSGNQQPASVVGSDLRGG